MEFKELFSEYRASIKGRLDEVIEDKKNYYDKHFDNNDEFFEIFRNFTTSGKMIRGSLFLLSAESNGCKKDRTLLNIACSLELMHSALLIHDDIMDRDEKRRGEKTIFSKYKEIASKKGLKNPDHYGISMGIVFGDIALFIAEEIAVEKHVDNLNDLLRFYTQELRNVGIGQMLDFDYGAQDKEVSKEDIKNMYIYKSARYSFTLPFMLGAIAAGLKDNNIKKIENLGEKMGLIFQLVDDDIGIFGNEEEIGKPIGSDIKENKKTFMRSLLMERVSIKDKKYIQSIYGKEDISKKEIDDIKKLITDLKVRGDIKKMIDDLYSESKEIIKKLKLDREYKDIYFALLDYNVSRIF